MFWKLEDKASNSGVLINDNTNNVVAYQELFQRVEIITEVLSKKDKTLIFLFGDNSIESIEIYLAALYTNNTIYLANLQMDDRLKNNLISIYYPEIIFSKKEIASLSDLYEHSVLSNKFSLYKIKRRQDFNPIYKDLAVLLSTSGTTGSPKFVRLSYSNLQSNAQSIAEYLSITENEKPITSLPMSYSFGLSVINSHLLKGASIVCTNQSMVMREFWNLFNLNNCTSFSGVPYNYQMLHRLKFDKLEIPSLKMMTQAGGRLSEGLIKYFYEAAINKNIKFFIMYGQTEATARISFVPFENLGNKIGSIGIAIPNGKIDILDDNFGIKLPKEEGELVYYGENVMLGYSETREDLSKGDEMKGILNTGDLAFKDEDGFLFITGRLKRFIKLFGLRINLDEIEKMIENKFSLPIAAIGTDDALKVLIQTSDSNLSELVNRYIIETYKLHHSFLSVRIVDSIPVTTSGKKDYNLIQELLK